MKRQLIALGYGLALPVGSAVAGVLVSAVVGAAMAAIRPDSIVRRPPGVAAAPR